MHFIYLFVYLFVLLYIGIWVPHIVYRYMSTSQYVIQTAEHNSISHEMYLHIKNGERNILLLLLTTSVIVSCGHLTPVGQ